MGYDVSALSNYVKENEAILIKDVVLGSDFKGSTIDKMNHQVGVKSKERMHPTNIDPTLQDATSCGFSAQGSTVISEREIETAPMKVNDQFCKKDLLGKFAEYEVRFGTNSEALPFEAEIADGYVKGTQKKLEKLVWQGDKTGNSDLIDGLLTIAGGADSASTITASTATGASAYEAIKKAALLIPEAILDDAVIFVSPALYKEYVMELVEKNLYHFAPDAKIEDLDITVPGTDIAVHRTYGMTGVNNKIYATSYKNIIYGCDMLGDAEEFKSWYSLDDDVNRIKIEFNAGVNTLFPDCVVVVTKN